MGRTAEDYLNVWRSWLGYSEANGKHKRIVDLYNSRHPLPRSYRVSYRDEWCDVAVSAAAIQAGMEDLIGRECGCEEHIRIFKKLGIWLEDGTIIPKPGYIIVYNWNDITQPNDGYADHIGVVEQVSGKNIICIEGNKNDAVSRRSIPAGWGYIRGFAAPKYETPAAPLPSAPGGEEKPQTRPGDSPLNQSPIWTGIVTTNGGTLNVRTWAGTEYPTCSFSPLSNKTEVSVCDTLKAPDGADWYYIRYKERYGFAHSAYIRRREER